jgi:protein-disulfide isomerase
VKIVEFGDYECSACQAFHKGMKAMLAKYPKDVQFVFRHFPLEYHVHARPAIRAAECAGEQGVYFAYHNAIFENPTRLGDWSELAVIAGVADTRAFEECVSATTPLPAIGRDLEIADRLGVTGTPAVIVNGVYLGQWPDSSRLDKLIVKAIE